MRFFPVYETKPKTLITVKSATRLIVGCLLLLIAGCLFPVFADPPVLSIATGEYPPWSSQKDENGGFIHVVIAEAFRLAGQNVVFAYYPWARSYELGKQGKHQASAYWECSPDRQKYFYCSDAIASEYSVFFHKKHLYLADWKSLADLKKYRICAIVSYTYTREFWEAVNNGLLNAILLTKDELCLRMLVRDRIDLMLVGLVAGQFLVNDMLKPEVARQITWHPEPLAKITFHLLFPKKIKTSQAVMQKFNKGLAELKSSGRYQQYYDRYFSSQHREKQGLLRSD